MGKEVRQTFNPPHISMRLFFLEFWSSGLVITVRVANWQFVLFTRVVQDKPEQIRRNRDNLGEIGIS
jgi:hypothetical protein